jgi:hypothetical protein
MLYVLILVSVIGLGGARFFTGSVCARDSNGCLSGVVCKVIDWKEAMESLAWKDATESLARRLLRVSFRGVPFLLRDCLGIGSGARFGGVHTGDGEKQLVRVGGSLRAGTLIEGSKAKTLDIGRCCTGSCLAMGFDLAGSVLLRPKVGFVRCGGGTHAGACDADVNEPVREGGSLGASVVAVEGRDEATLTIDERFDDMVDVSDARIMGDSPGDGSSTVATWTAFAGRVVLRLNKGFGINSVSMWKGCVGRAGNALLLVDRRRKGLRGGIGGVRLSVSVEAICSKLLGGDNHPAQGDGADDGRGRVWRAEGEDKASLVGKLRRRVGSRRLNEEEAGSPDTREAPTGKRRSASLLASCRLRQEWE